MQGNALMGQQGSTRERARMKFTILLLRWLPDCPEREIATNIGRHRAHHAAPIEGRREARTRQ
jgi:hypothetical protein